MLVKVVLLLLAVLVLIGWLGSLVGRRTWWSRLLARAPGLRRVPPAACPACGRPRVGPGPCPCGRA